MKIDGFKGFDKNHRVSRRQDQDITTSSVRNCGDLRLNKRTEETTPTENPIPVLTIKSAT